MKKKFYKMYDGRKVLGIYTAHEIRELLGCPTISVCDYAGKNRRYKKRYRFEVAEDVGTDWNEQWEVVRQRLRKSGYDLGKIRIMLERDA